MTTATRSTIAAVASPPGPARRGIIRLSGPESRPIVNAAAGEPLLEEDAPRGAFRGRLDDGGGSQPLLVLWMPGPASYTREDVAELHLPGSPPLLSQALARVLELGAEAAAPGEFTRRAFVNGRLDLTRAEGVLELVLATTDAEHRAASELFAGGLERRVAALRGTLDDARALFEATLDFDEADTGHVPADELRTLLEEARAGLEDALSWELAREAPSALPRIALLGAPNAGKSTLFNALTGEQAIVSELAGTTRDSLVGLWEPGTAPVLLVDTPGRDEEAHGADAEAQRLARAVAASADLVLWVVDASGAPAPDPEEEGEDGVLTPRLVVWSQIDRAAARPAPAGAIAVSGLAGSGLDALARRVRAALGQDAVAGVTTRAGGSPPLRRELFLRHRNALAEARDVLDRARSELERGAPPDLVAEVLRAATAALDRITGRTTPEDLLDRIFARFCLGK